MEQGSGNRAGLRPEAAGCALAAGLITLMLITLLPSSALAAPRKPPTAAEIERLTERFLDRQRQPATRGSGGVGIEDPDPKPEPPVDDSPLLGGDDVAVALYGAPQLTATAIGRRSPRGAGRRLREQARAYSRKTTRPVRRSINLIGVIATATSGGDGKYRARQADSVIRTYLKRARAVGARLTLDIQPGRSPVIRELRALREWIELPDVDVGIDPEWNVGRKGVPGRDDGSITHRELNRASRWVAKLVTEEELPAKAVIVHQFREGSIRGRSKVKQREEANVLLNFDGIGSRRAKKAGYRNLAQPGLFDGFSLFYDRDGRLLSPGGVLRIRPRVDYTMYQ
jgi:hypothetical protein